MNTVVTFLLYGCIYLFLQSWYYWDLALVDTDKCFSKVVVDLLLVKAELPPRGQRTENDPQSLQKTPANPEHKT